MEDGTSRSAGAGARRVWPLRAKEYLRQAFKIETRINSKLEQLEAMRSLAEKTTTTLEHAPKGQSSGKATENIIAKMADLENEIKADIEVLLDIKTDVQEAIKSVGEPELQVLLELRYLCYKSWGDIAAELNYDLRWVHRLHSKALFVLDEKHATKSH